MNLPQKVKHFALKAARDILASKEALQQRRIMVEGDCALCENPRENILHILWFCAHAKEVWNLSKFSLPFDIGPNWIFLDAMEKLQRYEEVQPNLAEQFVSVCWGIWKERNVIRTGGRGKPGRVTLKNSLGLMDECQMTNEGPRKLAAAASPELVSSPMVGPFGALETEAKTLEISMRFTLDIGIRDAVRGGKINLNPFVHPNPPT